MINIFKQMCYTSPAMLFVKSPNKHIHSYDEVSFAKHPSWFSCVFVCPYLHTQRVKECRHIKIIFTHNLNQPYCCNYFFPCTFILVLYHFSLFRMANKHENTYPIHMISLGQKPLVYMILVWLHHD